MITGWMQDLLVLAGSGLPIRALLTGPPGVGKTFFARTLAGALGAGFEKFSFSDSVTSEDVVYRVAIGDGNSVIYEESPLTRALEASTRGPVILLLDEVDKSRPRAEDLLLHILEEFTVAMPGGAVVKGNPANIHILATSNGRRDLREETLRRFLVRLRVDFPSPAEEREILHELGVQDNRAVSVLLNVAKTLRRVDPNKAPAYTELAFLWKAVQAGASKEVLGGTLWKGDGPAPKLGFNWYKALRRLV